MINKKSLTRRSFLSTSAISAASVIVAGCDGGRPGAGQGVIDYPFTLGVASGDPISDGVVLWTRLAPKPFEPVDPAAPPNRVGWEISEDRRFWRIVRTGVETATPQSAYAVHVEVGGLKPGQDYYYRFFVGDAVSPVGRTKTAPKIGAALDTLRFAVACCQSYTQGFYAAYGDLAAQAPDLVLHVGDYIYESPWTMPARRAPAPQALTLDDYRAFHAAAKTDRHLQAAHGAAPWVSVWDDHEVVNDYRGDHTPFGTTREAYVARRRAAYQAYYEHMPLRRRARPINGAMQLYQRSLFGDLVQFDMLDTRQYRDDHPCREEDGATPYWVSCDVTDPSRSLLGDTQETWLARGFGIGRAKWNMLVQSTQLTPFQRVDEEGVTLTSSDRWDGYPAARDRVFDLILDKAVTNPTLLGGDIHAFLGTSLVRADGGDPIANELVCAAISSGGGGDERYQAETATYASYGRPFFFENRRNGYLLCDLDHNALTAHARVVDNVLDPQSDTSTLTELVYKSGQIGLA